MDEDLKNGLMIFGFVGLPIIFLAILSFFAAPVKPLPIVPQIVDTSNDEITTEKYKELNECSVRYGNFGKLVASYMIDDNMISNKEYDILMPIYVRINNTSSGYITLTQKAYPKKAVEKDDE